jgi:DNA-binding transcriptional regulator LsrR (DeoR family)
VALDKNRLKTDLLAMMNSARDEEWTTDQVATAMSGAIDRYVRDGDVVGVSVKDRDADRVLDQSNKGRVQ